MACIYKITNLINDKVYVGKTLKTAEERWKEHCYDYKRKCCEKRPLYSAMKKYGIENFICETIEECTVDVINDREMYWIEYYNSFRYGYNATRGGDGKSYVDYDLICQLYKDGNTMTKIKQMTGHDFDTISKALKNNNIPTKSGAEMLVEMKRKSVVMIDKDTDEILQVFMSMTDAAQWLGISKDGHISQVCKGKRKTAYGYKWQYADENNDS